MMQMQEEERKRFAAMGARMGGSSDGGNGGAVGRNVSGGSGAGNGSNGAGVGAGTQTEATMGAGEMLVMEKGDNPAFVSLG